MCTPSVHVHTCIKKRSFSLSCHPPCFWNRTSHSPKSQLIRLCLAVPRDLPVFAQASLAPPQYSQDRCVPLYLSGFLTWDLWDAGSHTCRSNTLLTELGALILSSWVLGFLLLIPFILWTLDIQFNLNRCFNRTEKVPIQVYHNFPGKVIYGKEKISQ